MKKILHYHNQLQRYIKKFITNKNNTNKLDYYTYIYTYKHTFNTNMYINTLIYLILNIMFCCMDIDLYLFFRLQITTKTNNIPTINIPTNTGFRPIKVFRFSCAG